MISYPQFTYDLFHMHHSPSYLSREHMNPQLTRSQRQWLHSSVGRASHRYREVTGSIPVEVLNFFQASLRNCKNCDHNCEDHSSFDFEYCNYYFFLLQYYVVRWCNWCSRNVTAERTQFETVVLAGYTYNISVLVVTSYGPGRPSQIQKAVPPLSLQVSFAHTSITGRYGGLEVNLSWTKPSSSEHLVGKKNT